VTSAAATRTELEPAIVAPIFLCGTGRSGTTTLQEILQKRRKIYSTTHEGRFVVSPGGLFDIVRGIEQLSELRAFRQQMLGDWFQKVYRKGTPREYRAGLFVDIDRKRLAELLADFERQLTRAARNVARLFVEAFFHNGIDKRGGVRWMETTPANVIYMDQLLDLFPLAKFVHIIRDGRDVAASIVNDEFYPIADNPIVGEPFQGTPINVRNAARFWRAYLEKGRAIGRQLPESAYMEIRLEQLVAEPEQTLRSMCKFIGEPFDPQMLDVPLSSGKLRRWPSLFTEKDKDDFKYEAGDLLVALGYVEDNSW